MKPVKALLLGAGSRGRFAYGQYALLNPGMLKIAAVAERDDEKLKAIQKEHGIKEEFLYHSWEDAFKKLPPVEAVIIATQDSMHIQPIFSAIKNKLHILCEKPIAPALDECQAIQKAQEGFDKVFMVAHVLKYTPFFSCLKELLESGRIGRLVGMDLIENVGHIHHSHSFVRGAWRNSAESSPMILAKSCHDMDILSWLSGAQAESLSSYGALNYFCQENAPSGAPAYCLDGCPHGEKCPYHVSKIYLGENIDWPVNVITNDLSVKGRIKALEQGPYGRCVFHCDNDVVDYQTVSIHFSNGVNANFTMSAFTMAIHRGISLFGTEGEISGDMEDGRITIKDFSRGSTEVISLAQTHGRHSGGDFRLAGDFAACVRGSGGLARSVAKDSFDSHYMAFAAEASRLQGGRMVKLEDYRPK